MRVLLVTLVLTACGSSASTPPPSSVPASTLPTSVVPAPAGATWPGAHAGEPTSGAAFALVLSATYGESTTLLVPVDARVPARSIQSTMLLDDEAQPAVLRWVVSSTDAPDACECTCEGVPVSPMIDVITADDASLAALAQSTCRSFGGSACASGEDDANDDAYDAIYGNDDDDEGECEGAGGPIVTIVGGVAFAAEQYTSQCFNNVYNIDLVSRALTRATWAPPPMPARGVTCLSNFPGATVTTAVPGWPDIRALTTLACTRGAHGWSTTDEDLDCSDCRGPMGELIVPRITHGVLRLLAAHGTDDGMDDLWLADRPLSRADCPSHADPCGDAAAFPAIADADDFWVATDGSAAMASRGDTLEIFTAGSSSATRSIRIPSRASDVVGVRFHHDASLLAERIDHPPVAHHDRACPTAPAPAVATPPAACDIGQHRSAGGACETIALADEDIDFVDTHAGADWGNRCVLHTRAGELDAAEAACARGLAAAERDTTRGALYYNLGRIAERRGDAPSARARYQRSLTLRPGNATVQAALDALP